MDDKQYYIDIISGLAERTIKRLWIVIILLVVLLVGTNLAWIYYESQWEVIDSSVVQQVEADGENDVRLIGGDWNGGESEADSTHQTPGS